MSRADPAPLLVLGLGNRLLGDDGLGPELVDALGSDPQRDPRAEFLAEFLDGGTRGLALLGELEGRRALLLLDAVAAGAGAGALHVFADVDSRIHPRGFGAHGGNASELLAAARLTGWLPERVVLIGLEPHSIETRVGLSEPVRRAFAEARDAAERELGRLLSWLEVSPCTS